MTNPQATNSRNKSTRRRARPAAGAASCPAGEADFSLRGSVFVAKPGGAGYQVRAFSAPLLNASRFVHCRMPQKCQLAHGSWPISLRRFLLSAQRVVPHLGLGIHPEPCQEQLTVQALDAAGVRRWPWSVGGPYSIGSPEGPCWQLRLMTVCCRPCRAPYLWFPELNVSNFFNRDQNPNFGWAGFPFVAVNTVFFLKI
jgi:hypothetical protein